MVYPLSQAISAREIAHHLGLEMHGPDVRVSAVSTLAEIESNCLSFAKVMPEGQLDGVVICPGYAGAPNLSVLVSGAPRLDFIRALDFLVREVGFAHHDFETEIHSSAKIGSNVVIERGCVIGEGVVLEHNVVIHAGTTIGSWSRIRANASIGGDGFGFERLDDGTPVRFPHLGGVRIGSHVEIGSNTCVVRGTLGDTVVEDHVKIDNLVHLAHNCHVEQGAFIIACAEISGGVRIGRNAWVGPNASVLQKVPVGEESLVGIGAVVIKPVGSEEIHAGNPAKMLRRVTKE